MNVSTGNKNQFCEDCQNQWFCSVSSKDFKRNILILVLNDWLGYYEQLIDPVMEVDPVYGTVMENCAFASKFDIT